MGQGQVDPRAALNAIKRWWANPRPADPKRSFETVMSALRDRDSPPLLARAGRLWEESPRAYTTFSPDVMTRMLLETGTRAGARHLTLTPPKTFLNLASPLPMDPDIKHRVGALRTLLRREPILDDQLDAFNLRELEYYPQQYPRGFDGFADTSFLMLRPTSTDDLEVWGHEGRHRANALLAEYGDDPYPVELRPKDRSTWDRLWTEPFVRNQYDSQLRPLQDFVMLPEERYNKGGEVAPPQLPPLDPKKVKKFVPGGMTIR